MTESHYSSPWQTASAQRTYVASTLWLIGMLLALGADEPALVGWFRIRLDLAGVALLTACSTLLTLLVLPALYSTFEPRRVEF